MGSFAYSGMKLVGKYRDYAEFFTKPKKKWFDKDWKVILSVGIPMLVLMIFLFPRIENLIVSTIGPVIDPSKANQVQIGEKIAKTVGRTYLPWILGPMMAGWALFETLLFWGVFESYIEDKTGFNLFFVAIIVSGLFSLYHFKGPGLLLPFAIHTFIAGIYFSVSYYLGGIGALIIVHSGYNFSLVILPLVFGISLI